MTLHLIKRLSNIGSQLKLSHIVLAICMALALPIGLCAQEVMPAPVFTPTAAMDNLRTKPLDNVLLIGQSSSVTGSLSLFSSSDSLNFTSLRSEIIHSKKDSLTSPSLSRRKDGQFVIVYQMGGRAHLSRSRDLKQWQAIKTSFSAEGAEWYQAKNGALYLIYSQKGQVFARLSRDDSLTNFDKPSQLMGLPSGLSTPYITEDAKGLILVAIDEKTNAILIARAPSLNATWTVITQTPLSDFGKKVQDPVLVVLSDGTWRLYASDIQSKRMKYAQSTDEFASSSKINEITGARRAVMGGSILILPNDVLSEVLKPRGKPESVSWDRHSLRINDKPVLLYGGEFHPFRLPSPDHWRDVLQKMKATGMNMVSIYFDWGYHTSEPGHYDFAGVRNMERAIEMAEDEGFYVIVRMGPYINAEITRGGYPGWLARQDAMARSDNPAYLAAADEWLTQIDAIIARHQITTGGGRVVAFQIENELGRREPEQVRYMEHVAKKVRQDSISLPLFHNAAGRLPDWLPQYSAANWGNKGPTDMYGFDGYPGGTCNLDANVGKPNVAPDWGIYSTTRPKAGSLSSPLTPGYAAEIGGGWFDYWGSNGTYECTAKRLGPGYERLFYGVNLMNGLSIHSIYVYFGGTSWGWMPASVVYTSYDYGAPLSEARVLRDKALALKPFHMGIRAMEDSLIGMEPSEPLVASHKDVKLYHNFNLKTRTQFVFAAPNKANDMAERPFSMTVKTASGDYTIPQAGALTLNGHDGKMFALDYRFGEQNLIYSTSEVQTHFSTSDWDLLLLHGRTDEDGETVLRFGNEPKISVLEGNVTPVWDPQKKDLRLNYHHHDLIKVLITANGQRPVLVLIADEKTSWKLWRQETAKGPLLVRSEGLIRDAKFVGDALDLSGDVGVSAPLEIWGVNVLKAISFNGQKLGQARQKDGSYITFAPRAPEVVAVPDLMAGKWLRREDSFESQVSFDDSSWMLTDNRGSAATYDTKSDLHMPTLAMSDYGFHHGDVWYRGHFTITDPKTRYLEMAWGGGGAGMIMVWLDGKLIHTEDLATGRAFPQTRDTLRLKLEASTIGKGDHILAVMVRNNSHNWDLFVDDAHKEARGLYSVSLASPDAQRHEIDIKFRIQGNQGGEAITDLARGPYNNGGLGGERLGWYLPGAPTKGWTLVDPLSAPPSAGTYWLRRDFELNMPDDQDVQLGLSFGDTTKPRSPRAYRVLIFVNGWHMGQFVAHIGPQRTFIIPPGLLKAKGTNTIALAITTDGAVENAPEPFKLEVLNSVRSSLTYEAVASPTYQDIFGQ